MARLPRIAVAGRPHLVIQRVVGAQSQFLDDSDRYLYLEALKRAGRSCSVAIHAYALLESEICLLLTPTEGAALGRFVQGVARHYVPMFNQRHGRQGALWSGRFHSTVLEPEEYLLPAIRFVEQAAVRAGIVVESRDWRWSSAEHHLGRRASSLVTEHPIFWRLGNTPFERQARHELELQKMLLEVEVANFHDAARSGWPLGSTAFTAAVGQAIGRSIERRSRGRPRLLP